MVRRHIVLISQSFELIFIVGKIDIERSQKYDNTLILDLPISNTSLQWIT